MKWLLVLSLVACQPTAAVVVTPSPTPVVTPTPVVITPAPTPAPTPWVPVLNPRRVEVSFGMTAGAVERAAMLSKRLPEAWARATGGRSTLVLVSPLDLAPVFLTVRDLDLSPVRGLHAALAGGRIRVIDVYRPRTAADEALIRTVLHELGHALGCCDGPGGHWADCDEEIMCHTGTQLVFSERELAQMGLR